MPCHIILCELHISTSRPPIFQIVTLLQALHAKHSQTPPKFKHILRDEKAGAKGNS